MKATNKTKYLKLKYGKIMQEYEQYNDDRKLAYNMYNQILEVLEDLQNCNNSYIYVAVTIQINSDCLEIDDIIARFENK